MSVTHSTQEHLRHILSTTATPVRPRTVVIGSRTATPFGVLITQGRLVYEYARMSIGDEAMSHILQTGLQLWLPRDFWPACCHFSFHRVCTPTFRKSLRKALRYYMIALRNGATTACGMLGEKMARQKRSWGGALNAVKCPELGQLLYDWFIDCVQVYRARVNSSLIMGQARYLAKRLQNQGYEPNLIPKLTGEAAKSWFRRWRKRRGVVNRRVKHLKVLWRKLKERVRVYLQNVFALRFLWQRCFPDKAMRWISWDQKPAWFNNTAMDGSYAPKGCEPRQGDRGTIETAVYGVHMCSTWC